MTLTFFFPAFPTSLECFILCSFEFLPLKSSLGSCSAKIYCFLSTRFIQCFFSLFPYDSDTDLSFAKPYLHKLQRLTWHQDYSPNFLNGFKDLMTFCIWYEDASSKNSSIFLTTKTAIFFLPGAYLFEAIPISIYLMLHLKKNRIEYWERLIINGHISLLEFLIFLSLCFFSFEI